jgi:hypothetical protein
MAYMAKCDRPDNTDMAQDSMASFTLETRDLIVVNAC